LYKLALAIGEAILFSYFEVTMTRSVVSDEKIKNLSREALMLHWHDLPREEAERLLELLPEALSRVFTNDVLKQLEQNSLLEECILQGSLGPLEVARTVLEKLADSGLVSPSSAEELLGSRTENTA